MKKIIFGMLCGLLLACNSAIAQGNLQFNQAIKLEVVGTHPVNGSGTIVQFVSQTVNIPVGKVWKIESSSLNITRGTISTINFNSLFMPNGPIALYMDNSIICTTTLDNGAYTLVPKQIYWLPAGSHTFSLYGAGVGAAVPYTYTGMITAIEFNIVP